MHFGEALRFSLNALRANLFRTFLTALGLVIGNASVILVVTISLTGQDYILDQIRGIGSNLIWANYEAGSQGAVQVDADFVKLLDVEALRQQLAGRIVAATPVMTNYDRMRIAGRDQDIAVIGTDQYYPKVRHLVMLAGSFMDADDVVSRNKVAILTEKLAARLYGGQQAAIGRVIKLHGLQFTVVGTFREKTSTFGLAELTDETVIIPITVIKNFAPIERIDPVYIQVRNADDVESTAKMVKTILESRHRLGARYHVDTLTAILDAAKKIALILSVVLVLISAIALIISGIGIMNIMLVTVTERTREIGLRMAVGASRREVLQQFLLEAMMISFGGGTIGILFGIAIPLSAQFFTDAIQVPVSVTSVLVAFGVSFLVGVVFGFLPARRAAQLNPTEALRYE